MTEIDLAAKILSEKGEPIHYKELLTEAIKQASPDFPDDQVELQKKLAKLYTELTLDSRFVALGKGMWGLAKWSAQAKILKSGEEEKEEQEKRKGLAKRGDSLNDYDYDVDEDLDIDEEFEEDEDLVYDDEGLLIEDEDFDELPLEDEELEDFDDDLIGDEDEWD